MLEVGTTGLSLQKKNGDFSSMNLSGNTLVTNQRTFRINYAKKQHTDAWVYLRTTCTHTCVILSRKFSYIFHSDTGDKVLRKLKVLNKLFTMRKSSHLN